MNLRTSPSFQASAWRRVRSVDLDLPAGVARQLPVVDGLLERGAQPVEHRADRRHGQPGARLAATDPAFGQGEVDQFLNFVAGDGQRPAVAERALPGYAQRQP